MPVSTVYSLEAINKFQYNFDKIIDSEIERHTADWDEFLGLSPILLNILFMNVTR